MAGFLASPHVLYAAFSCWSGMELRTMLRSLSYHFIATVFVSPHANSIDSATRSPDEYVAFRSHRPTYLHRPFYKKSLASTVSLSLSLTLLQRRLSHRQPPATKSQLRYCTVLRRYIHGTVASGGWWPTWRDGGAGSGTV